MPEGVAAIPLQGTLLAFDFGEKRIGVAVGNSISRTAQPLLTIQDERNPPRFAAIAGLLGQGLEPFTAIYEAQEYTWETLKHGYRIGMGQHLPNRLFWARAEAE